MDKKIDTFVKQSLTIFIILLPIALITGPFLSDLIISLCSIIFIFYCISIYFVCKNSLLITSQEGIIRTGKSIYNSLIDDSIIIGIVPQ